MTTSKGAQPVRRASHALIAVLLVLALAPAPGLALAHAQIATSSPPAGATVAPGLTQIILNFTEDVSPEQSSARITRPDGSAIPGVKSAVDRGMRTRMIVNTPPLQPGDYTVKWLAVTDDDNAHTNGSINFAVADSSSIAGLNTVPGAQSSQPAPGLDTTWLVVLGLLAGALLLALIWVGMLRRRARTAGRATSKDSK
jgi:methionine-rich copper-binding protein CopC